MKTVRFLLTAVVALTVLTGCDKEEVMHHEQAGAWIIKSITTTWYTAGAEDSSAVVADAGVLQLWDNHSENDNIAEYEFFKPAPSSIYDVANSNSGLDPQGSVCWWHAGPGSSDRLTLWYDSPLVDDFVIYTVTEVKRSKMTLTYVRTDSQNRMALKEVWQMESY